VAENSPELLTLQEAAEQLKVHYMTAYRWVRRGDLPAFKAGGRLRVQASDVERFVQQRRIDVVLPGAAGRTDWPTHVDRLYTLLAAGQAQEAGHLVRKVIADGAPVGQVYLELLTPVLHRVGDAWAAGEISVAEEHRASEICAGIIARHGEAFRRRGPSRGTAVTLTPPHELHGVAAAMVADFLRAGGYEVHHLGVNVPIDDLRLFLAIVQCDVLCVSMTVPLPDPSLYADLVEACGDATTVIFGGQAADAEQVAAVNALHVRTLAELVAAVDSVTRDVDLDAAADAEAVSAGS
jgi:excisionase family DNA binding protein